MFQVTVLCVLEGQASENLVFRPPPPMPPTETVRLLQSRHFNLISSSVPAPGKSLHIMIFIDATPADGL